MAKYSPLSAMGDEIAVDSAAAISKFSISNGHCSYPWHCIVSYMSHSPSGVTKCPFLKKLGVHYSASCVL